MKLSRCFIQTDSSAPNAVCLQSLCNPTPKLANFPESQHRITSPLSFSPRPCFHHLSFSALFSSMFLRISVFQHLLSLFGLSPSSPPPPLCHDLLPSPSGTHSVVVMAGDCGIPAAVLMMLPSGQDQPEKYS